MDTRRPGNWRWDIRRIITVRTLRVWNHPLQAGPPEQDPAALPGGMMIDSIGNLGHQQRGQEGTSSCNEFAGRATSIRHSGQTRGVSWWLLAWRTNQGEDC